MQTCVGFRKDRLGDGAAHLLADKRQQGNFLAIVVVRLAVMDVDDTDDIAPADQRDRKKSFVGVLDQGLKAFETGVRGRLGR